jgi:predicted RNA binding protein YcfA (HicA-like mRNA interferase family)
MAKPFNGRKPSTLRPEQLERIYNKLGFEKEKGNHRHIVFRDSHGREIILKKGNKVVSSKFVEIIIKEVAEKTGKTKQEVLEFFMRNK